MTKCTKEHDKRCDRLNVAQCIEIISRFMSAQKQTDIAKDLKISRQRVEQIITATIGLKQKSDIQSNIRQFRLELKEEKRVKTAKTLGQCIVRWKDIKASTKHRNEKSVSCSRRCAIIYHYGNRLLNEKARITHAIANMKNKLAPIGNLDTWAAGRKAHSKNAETRRTSQEYRAYDLAVKLRFKYVNFTRK